MFNPLHFRFLIVDSIFSSSHVEDRNNTPIRERWGLIWRILDTISQNKNIIRNGLLNTNIYKIPGDLEKF